MSASDPTPLTGVFIMPDGEFFPNKVLLWRKTSGAISAVQGDVNRMVIPGPVRVTTNAVGAITCAFVTGNYTVSVETDDGVRVFGVAVPVSSSAVDVATLQTTELVPFVGQAEAAAIAAATSAGAASASAGAASASASTASASATTATTQADIATTQASAAVQSAASAGNSATQAAADRVQTGLDRVATAADRAATSADRVATAADRVQTGEDRVEASASAANAATFAVVDGAQTFVSIAAGIAAVPDNGVFYVPQAAGGLLVYRRSGASSVQIGTFFAPMQSTTDATPGRLQIVGAFGDGGTELPNAADPNAITVSGKYRVFGSANAPSASTFVLEHFQRFSGQAVQIAYLMGSPQRLYQRHLWLGAWTTWRTYSETVGAVTQFGGLATGACMEAGTNANGRFERFAHGMQECWQPALTAPNSNTVFGSRWRSADVTWNFPASFLTGAVPAISAVCIDGDSDARVLSVTNTTAVLRVVSDISKSGAITIHVRAKGRWADITG